MNFRPQRDKQRSVTLEQWCQPGVREDILGGTQNKKINIIS
jgi:hypothetical protein